MPEQKRAPRSVPDASGAGGAPPAFGELLASCAAAEAISRPPAEDARGAAASRAAVRPEAGLETSDAA
ncbi:hypothetical protein V1J52_07490 [Streptomyces sp. TRM 70351]|uniref:hypothetical protein n=1 Tax=Streptomyces sp. TRM 70351 TaxID=3116552 RepID=UPI002E7BC6E3|nr:hypothetical protein [Streptomyces sp. TRM 70351]MEE1928039.1 hypothetical protein [Streptomyces sp. TRM 70351]